MTSHTLPDISDSAPRVATSADAAVITGVLTDAFGSDPIWATWAFPGHHAPSELRRAVFRILIEGALRFEWVWLTPGDTATSVWFPPGESELTPRQEAALDALLRDSLGTGAGRILRSFEQFETARPQAHHYYLSLVGTDPRHAAHGYGQKLLSANLRLLDCDGAPAYLEADDALVPLYQRYGFRVTGRFELPDGPGVNSMWRPAAAARHLGVR